MPHTSASISWTARCGGGGVCVAGCGGCGGYVCGSVQRVGCRVSVGAAAGSAGGGGEGAR